MLREDVLASQVWCLCNNNNNSNLKLGRRLSSTLVLGWLRVRSSPTELTCRELNSCFNHRHSHSFNPRNYPSSSSFRRTTDSSNSKRLTNLVWHMLVRLSVIITSQKSKNLTFLTKRVSDLRFTNNKKESKRLTRKISLNLSSKSTKLTIWSWTCSMLTAMMAPTNLTSSRTSKTSRWTKQPARWTRFCRLVTSTWTRWRIPDTARPSKRWSYLPFQKP